MTVKAIYNHGVFRPVQPVDLPEDAEVQVVLPSEAPPDTAVAAREQARVDIFEILSHRYPTGQTDTAARHDEHQP
jgi:predicted DNA-binding antitoxin AbrB/MazE fold protein